MSEIKTNGIYGIEQWRKVVKAAGQQIIDNADRFIADGESVRSMEITIKGMNPFEIPVIEVKKDYNIPELSRSVSCEMIGYVAVYIDKERIYRVTEIGQNEVSGYISLTFADRGYIPRISRFKYHMVQLIYWQGDRIGATKEIITKGLKRRKNTLYLKISNMFMEKWNEM